MSKRSSEYEDSFQEISFEVSTSKKYKKSNEFTMPSSMGKTQQTYPTTQRKVLTYTVDNKVQMDQVTTPLKQQLNRNKQSFNGNQQVSQTSKYKEILVRLDETQQKLVLSQKKYGQLWRKYESSCQTIKKLTVSKDNDNPKHHTLQQSSRISQWQMKYNLLNRESQQYLNRLKIKQEENINLKDKLERVTIELRRSQQQIEQKLTQLNTMSSEVREKEEMIKRMESQLKTVKQVQGRSYERIVASLRHEIQQMQRELDSKAEEILKMQNQLLYSNSSGATQLHSSNKFNNKDNHNNQQSLLYILQQQLARVHRQKLTVIASYEQKITLLLQSHQQQVRLIQTQLSEKLQQQMVKTKEQRLRREEIEFQLTRGKAIYNKNLQSLKEENLMFLNQLQYLKQMNHQLQEQLNNMLTQSYNGSLKQAYSSSPSLHSQSISYKQSHHLQQQSLHELSSQLQSIKHQITILNNSLQHKSQLLQMATLQKDKLFQQVLSLQEKCKHQSLQLIQNNTLFKTHIDNLLKKVSFAEQEKQLIQKQLLAQRLQTFKLKQQLQQLSENLKKQYQLSLQNLNKQLSMKIHQTNKLKNIETKQKEQIYIQLKQLEKKYELLTSQMLTVDDMMSIATKVHKRHSHFVKK